MTRYFCADCGDEIETVMNMKEVPDKTRSDGVRYEHRECPGDASD